MVDINIDIDNIVTDLNGKADRDLTNAVGALSSSAKEYFTKISLPSDRYVDLTLPVTNTTVTAPANGYFTVAFYAGSGTLTPTAALVNTVSKIGTRSNSKTSDQAVQAFLPCKKDDVVEVSYQNVTLIRFRFIYAVGSESEE